MSEVNAVGAAPEGTLLRIYKTTGGTKKMEPPVVIAHIKDTEAVFKVKCMATGWQVESITFEDPRITYDPRKRIITVPKGIRRGYFEYAVTLTNRRDQGITEIVQGNSRPGVLVDD